MGSSRDWAAKGTFLLGVKAVIATSFERIHRSNLVMMGVLPLTFPEGETADSLGLDGTETFAIDVDDDLQPRQLVQVTATKTDGATVEFMATCRCDTPVEVEYLRNGGILHMVLRRMAREFVTSHELRWQFASQTAASFEASTAELTNSVGSLLRKLPPQSLIQTAAYSAAASTLRVLSPRTLRMSGSDQLRRSSSSVMAG